MPIPIHKVLPWGRSFDEYVRMFALDDADIGRRILGCGDGPAAFNASLTARGGSIVSVDPLYEHAADAIASRIEEARALIVANTESNMEAYRWDEISSIDALVAIRMRAMRDFLADYDVGKATGRYIAAELPLLPFEAGEFDLALCSHFLFTYSEQLDSAFHVNAILEMLRVAGEVRVFPVLDMNGGPSHHLEPVVRELAARAFDATTRPVPYEYQIGGNRMLRVVATD